MIGIKTFSATESWSNFSIKKKKKKKKKAKDQMFTSTDDGSAATGATDARYAYSSVSSLANTSS